MFCRDLGLNESTLQLSHAVFCYDYRLRVTFHCLNEFDFLFVSILYPQYCRHFHLVEESVMETASPKLVTSSLTAWCLIQQLLSLRKRQSY